MTKLLNGIKVRFTDGEEGEVSAVYRDNMGIVMGVADTATQHYRAFFSGGVTIIDVPERAMQVRGLLEG